MSHARIPKYNGMYMFLGNAGELWAVEKNINSMEPNSVENTASGPQDDSDHNMNINNTTQAFRWCDPTGFWEWNQTSGVRKVPVALGWARYHCWYLSRGGMARAVVLTNDYLMVIDANYGLANAGALKI